MAVRCEGDLRIMEQLGERQDFESELSRLGMRHEDFRLHVRKAAFNEAKKTWTSNYAIRVTNSVTGRRTIYWAARDRIGLHNSSPTSAMDFMGIS